MLFELYRGFITAYETYRGNGKIISVLIISLLFLYLKRSEGGFNPFTLIVAPLAGISTAVTKVISLAKDKLGKVFVIFLCAFGIMLMGGRLYSQEHMYKAENAMHIPENYKLAMDYVLSQNDSPKVAAMPDYSMYHTMYSSSFDMLYEQRNGDDIRYLPENARLVFTELSGRHPIMITVSESCAQENCDYIILESNYYWAEIPLEYYEQYELETSLGGFDIYARREEP